MSECEYGLRLDDLLNGRASAEDLVALEVLNAVWGQWGDLLELVTMGLRHGPILRRTSVGGDRIGPPSGWG